MALKIAKKGKEKSMTAEYISHCRLYNTGKTVSRRKQKKGFGDLTAQYKEKYKKGYIANKIDFSKGSKITEEDKRKLQYHKVTAKREMTMFGYQKFTD